MHWLLNRRVNCAWAALGIASICYGVYSSLILDRIGRFMSRYGPIDPTAPLHDDVARFLSMFEIAVIVGVLPTIWWALVFHAALRRWYRARHDLCLECGRPITDWHGCCPRCGTRVGPGLPARRYAL